MTFHYISVLSIRLLYVEVKKETQPYALNTTSFRDVWGSDEVIIYPLNLDTCYM
jgi:hypothetical protein